VKTEKDKIEVEVEVEVKDEPSRYCQLFCCVIPDDDFSVHFLNELVCHRLYFGCSPLIYENGLRIQNGAFNKWFPLGFYEDFVFYFINNNAILSTFMSVRGSPYSRGSQHLPAP